MAAVLFWVQFNHFLGKNTTLDTITFLIHKSHTDCCLAVPWFLFLHHGVLYQTFWCIMGCALKIRISHLVISTLTRHSDKSRCFHLSCGRHSKAWSSSYNFNPWFKIISAWPKNWEWALSFDLHSSLKHTVKNFLSNNYSSYIYMYIYPKMTKTIFILWLFSIEL